MPTLTGESYKVLKDYIVECDKRTKVTNLNIPEGTMGKINDGKGSFTIYGRRYTDIIFDDMDALEKIGNSYKVKNTLTNITAVEHDSDKPFKIPKDTIIVKDTIFSKEGKDFTGNSDIYKCNIDDIEYGSIYLFDADNTFLEEITSGGRRKRRTNKKRTKKKRKAKKTKRFRRRN
jgi:hypothetical protein